MTARDKNAEMRAVAGAHAAPDRNDQYNHNVSRLED
jgi:hypothetical protein